MDTQSNWKDCHMTMATSNSATATSSSHSNIGHTITSTYNIPLSQLTEEETIGIMQEFTIQKPKHMCKYGPKNQRIPSLTAAEFKGNYICVPRMAGIQRYQSPSGAMENGQPNPPLTSIDVCYGDPINPMITFNGTLCRDRDQHVITDNLKEWADSVRSQPLRLGGGGSVRAPPGKGKTVTTCWFIHYAHVKTAVIVHTNVLMNQWRDRIEFFLPNARIGKVQGNIVDVIDKDIILVMVQSASQKTYPPDTMKGVGLIVCDEAHLMCAPTFTRFIRNFPAGPELMLALSATPKRKDGYDIFLPWTFGPELYGADIEDTSTTVLRIELNGSHFQQEEYWINKPENIRNSAKMMTRLAEDPCRNIAITMITELLLACGRRPIALGNRVDQLVTFAKESCARHDPNALCHYTHQSKSVKVVSDPIRQRIVELEGLTDAKWVKWMTEHPEDMALNVKWNAKMNNKSKPKPKPKPNKKNLQLQLQKQNQSETSTSQSASVVPTTNRKRKILVEHQPRNDVINSMDNNAPPKRRKRRNKLKYTDIIIQSEQQTCHSFDYPQTSNTNTNTNITSNRGDVGNNDTDMDNDTNNYHNEGNRDEEEDDDGDDDDDDNALIQFNTKVSSAPRIAKTLKQSKNQNVSNIDRPCTNVDDDDDDDDGLLSIPSLLTAPLKRVNDKHSPIQSSIDVENNHVNAIDENMLVPTVIDVSKRQHVGCVVLAGANRPENLAVLNRASIVFASTTLFSVGGDADALDTEIMLSPLSDVRQAVGRIQRKHPTKKSPLVIDLVDGFGGYPNQSNQRLKFYKSANMSVFTITCRSTNELAQKLAQWFYITSTSVKFMTQPQHHQIFIVLLCIQQFGLVHNKTPLLDLSNTHYIKEDTLTLPYEMIMEILSYIPRDCIIA